MNKTAKILTLISPAIAVIILSAAIAGIQPSHSTPPPVPAQPTEWWALEHPPGMTEDLQSYTCKHDPDDSPASYYELATSAGYKPRLTEKGSAVTIETEHDNGMVFYWFRSKATCERAIQNAKEAALAEEHKHDQFLAPYR